MKKLHWFFCLAAAWMLTNGWAYLTLLLGTVLHLSLLKRIASVYLAILWLPCTPEKILTVLIAAWLMKKTESKKRSSRSLY